MVRFHGVLAPRSNVRQALEAPLKPSNGKKDATLYDYDDVDVVPLHHAFNQRAF